jgi:hypothetical protein
MRQGRASPVSAPLRDLPRPAQPAESDRLTLESVQAYIEALYARHPRMRMILS